jgi:hyperosmotically inducible periplasmic protein
MNWKNIAIASMVSAMLAGPALAKDDPGTGVATPATVITPADLSLAASVQATLANDRELSYWDLGVSAKDGVVELTGTLRSDSERSRAIKDAKSVPGVRTVSDNISIFQSDY